MEPKSSAQRAYEIFLAALAWAAVLLQIFLVQRSGTANAAASGFPHSPLRSMLDTVSYFTVLSNLLVAVVTTAVAFRADPSNEDDPRGISGFLTRQGTLAAVAVYIFVVGLIYSVLLRGVWNPAGWQLVADRALHDAVPVLYVLYWLIFVPKQNLRWSQPLWWLIYPAVYCLYSWVFGTLTGKFMYWFADPTTMGWPNVIKHLALMLLFFLLLGEIAVGIGRLRRG
jgi:hypothetical protein